MKNEKLKVGQQFDVDIMSPTCNLIENKTPQQIFFLNFQNFFSLIMISTRLCHKRFPKNFTKFSREPVL